MLLILNALDYSCPVPTCKTPKRKVKRLRPLPPKWLDLPAETKQPIVKELRELKTCSYIHFIHILYTYFFFKQASCKENITSHFRGNDPVPYQILVELNEPTDIEMTKD